MSNLQEKDKEAGVKSVEDKTFYLSSGFWTDSTFDAKSAKPQIISFGSKDYFDLIRSNPGISKYLSVGQQVILMYKGHCYKIVGATST